MHTEYLCWGRDRKGVKTPPVNEFPLFTLCRNTQERDVHTRAMKMYRSKSLMLMAVQAFSW